MKNNSKVQPYSLSTTATTATTATATTTTRGGSFLNSSHSNRFQSFDASKSSITATKRTSSKLRQESTHDNQTSGLSHLPLHGYSPSTQFQNEKLRKIQAKHKISLESKLVYTVILTCVLLIFVSSDTNKVNNVVKNKTESESSTTQLNPEDQSLFGRDVFMNEFQSSNNVQMKPKQPTMRYNTMYTGNYKRNNNDFNSNQKKDSTQLGQLDQVLMDALNSNDNKNMRLTITVGDDEDSTPKRSSGLKPSPGVPLSGQQNLQTMMSRRGRQIYKPSKKLLNKVKTYPHQISNLHCVLYNGPEYNIAQEVVYWEDIELDSSYEGPFFHVNGNMNDDDDELKGERDSLSKYLTFQPDTGGFNSNRMAFETALVLSVAMGRTLVLPPRQKIPLMFAGTLKEQLISFDDIYHLDSLTKEFESVNIITMKEFLIREGLQPGDNKSNWDGAEDINELWTFLEQKAYVANSWNRNQCVAAFPSTADNYGNDELIKIFDQILSGSDGRAFPHHLDFQGKPVSTKAPAIERLREMMADRLQLCLYSEKMQNAPIIHFPTKPPNQRLLTHFYSFVFFEDWAQGNWIKRLIRDHLRYNDEIMCAAARVIEAMRQSCYSRSNPNGIYDSLHIRMKKFDTLYLNYNMTSMEVLLSLSELPQDSCIFIATDDFDEEFFQPIKEKYNLFHLDDFKELLYGLNPNFYGLIEQVVVARGRQFHGSFYSSFSGYINRLRGYYSTREMIPESHEGVLQDTFYMPSKFKNENKIYKAVQKPFFAREYPTAWRDIEKR